MRQGTTNPAGLFYPICSQCMTTQTPSRAGTCYIPYSISNTCSHPHKSHAKDIKEMGGTWSLIWSIGRIPEQIISALVEMKDGITRPGQSQRHRPGSTYRVYTRNNKLSSPRRGSVHGGKRNKRSNALMKHRCK